jgi:hypothetical protein
MQFIFVCAGWEDNTHDTCFFLEAIDNPNIRLLKPSKGNIIKKKIHVILRGNFNVFVTIIMTNFSLENNLQIHYRGKYI